MAMSRRRSRTKSSSLSSTISTRMDGSAIGRRGLQNAGRVMTGQGPILSGRTFHLKFRHSGEYCKGQLICGSTSLFLLMRFLIIDDEENIRKTTAVVLESMGHETVGVE